ncbi:MAG: hypothetical protein CL916_00860 [Deltaproteobacteria bacterium]|nr:hypothetical protein [Deltaproteobacteria bacterium]
MIAFVFLSLMSAFAVSPPQSFAHLKKIDIEGSAYLFVDPSVNCKMKEQNLSENLEELGYQGPLVYDVCVLTIAGKKMQVVFGNGSSEDPYFELYPLNEKGEYNKSILSVAATTLYIPNGKNVYAEGWTNSMFNHRRKFSFDGSTFQEVKQPMHYVGITTTVQNIEPEKKTYLTLYQDKSKSKKVAVLPQGSEIEVLLCEDSEWYLVRSSFGLVGWVYVIEGLRQTKIGVRFAGD